MTPRTDPSAADRFIAIAKPDEFVVDRKTGQMRQAGASTPEGDTVKALRTQAEADLYVLTKLILKRNLLSKNLHRWQCRWLQRTPPYRKMMLMPRGHLKSSVISEALPIHQLIQPDEHNRYWPGMPGAEMRILLMGEKQELMSAHLRWIETQFESNEYLRSLWPHRCWDNPRKESKKWNESEMLLPRKQDYADPTIRVIGVGGAITGAHITTLIKDDLISVEAANSPIVMESAIESHIASRALLAPFEDTGLEYIIGTRWAVKDLYEYIIENDSTVEVTVRSILEDGELIWPERITHAHVAALRKEYGRLFPLLYMNSANDPTLTDFAEADLRYYTLLDGKLLFTEDERDEVLRDRDKAPPRAAPDGLRGQHFTADLQEILFNNRDEYFRRVRQ